MAKKIKKWVQDIRDSGKLSNACINVQTIIDRYDSDEEYYADIPDPGLFLAGIAYRQKNAAIYFLRTLVIATLAPVPPIITKAINDSTNKNLNILARSLRFKKDRVSIIARRIARIRLGQISSNNVWIVTQLIIKEYSNKNKVTEQEAKEKVVAWLHDNISEEIWSSGLGSDEEVPE